MTGFEDLPLSKLLTNREAFKIFDTEFQRFNRRLDAAVLISSESSVRDLYSDNTVPKEVLDKVVEKLKLL